MTLAVEQLPSARVLAAIQDQYAGRFDAFALARSGLVKQSLCGVSLTDDQQAVWRQMADVSVVEQARIESEDVLPFELFRQAYIDPQGLTVAASSSTTA